MHRCEIGFLSMGRFGFSKPRLCVPCKDFVERMGDCLNRPISGNWPDLCLDATYLKTRRSGTKPMRHGAKRPRMTLYYFSPAEVFQECVAAIV